MSTVAAERPRTIRTSIPARLDRLPWSRFHWRIIIGLGTVWILDGLEVTIVGAIAPRMTEPGSGISIDSADIGTAAAFYVAGACLGALFFGQLTDKHGRKRLFMVTLGLYLLATVATAFATEAWMFFIFRFFTGMGIGGEYAAINSAIDELIPARNRGQVDLAINGSFWVGSGIGGIAALLLLDTAIFNADIGWRLAFGAGAILGLGILLVRRHVPESPRWLFLHGRVEEAERIVGEIEQEVQRETGEELREPGDEIVVQVRESTPYRELVRIAFQRYPRRAILGLSLFIGQAFLYNAVTFDLGTILNRLFDVRSGQIPWFMVLFAASNFLGPLLLGRLFDTVGRIPMIAGTYLGSAAMVVVLGILLASGSLTTWSFMALIMGTFFLASAGASSAYLTVSEVFPMETRALAIALFYAVGTAVGGITGPVLFGQMIHTGDPDMVALAFYIGAFAMALGGVAELLFGVRAEQQSLENIARPLTAVEADADAEGDAGTFATAGNGAGRNGGSDRAQALESREGAERERAEAAEHRARLHELRSQPAAEAEGAGPLLAVEEVLVVIADLRAEALEERAAAADERARAASADDGPRRMAALARAAAHEQHAAEAERTADALAAEHAAGGPPPVAHPRESPPLGTPPEEIARAGAWHEEAARHRAAADEISQQLAALPETARAPRDGERRGPREQQRERDERIRTRAAHRAERARRGPRRYRPGPGRAFYSPGMIGTAGTTSRHAAAAEEALDREIEDLARVLAEQGELERARLSELVRGPGWGPGRFRRALREAVEEGRAGRRGGRRYGPSG
jgi:MFS family permease